MSKESEERDVKIYEMKQSGLSFTRIGFEFGISRGRARQIYERYASSLTPCESFDSGLSTMAKNVLKNAGIKSKEQAIDALNRGLSHKDMKGCGVKTIKEIREYFGCFVKICPCCGQPIKPDHKTDA